MQTIERENRQNGNQEGSQEGTREEGSRQEGTREEGRKEEVTAVNHPQGNTQRGTPKASPSVFVACVFRQCSCGYEDEGTSATERFVTGHDFSRAANAAKSMWASTPAPLISSATALLPIDPSLPRLIAEGN